NNRSCLKHYLHAADHFIELIVAKLRMRFAEIRPGMNVVKHQLNGVAVDVVVEPAGDRMDAVVTHLTRITILESDCCLEFFRKNEIAALNVPTTWLEVGEPGCNTVDRATVHLFGKIFTDQIERSDVDPCLHAPGCALVRAGKSER